MRHTLITFHNTSLRSLSDFSFARLMRATANCTSDPSAKSLFATFKGKKTVLFV